MHRAKQSTALTEATGLLTLLKYVNTNIAMKPKQHGVVELGNPSQLFLKQKFANQRWFLRDQPRFLRDQPMFLRDLWKRDRQKWKRDQPRFIRDMWKRDIQKWKRDRPRFLRDLWKRDRQKWKRDRPRFLRDLWKRDRQKILLIRNLKSFTTMFFHLHLNHIHKILSTVLDVIGLYLLFGIITNT
jgi:hypothetical protein